MTVLLWKLYVLALWFQDTEKSICIRCCVGLPTLYSISIDWLNPLPLCVPQVKSNLDKAKQALEKETSELTVEVRSLTTAKQDVENKKRKVEGQLNELQARFTDSEKQKGELGERCSKITVSDDDEWSHNDDIVTQSPYGHNS